MTEPIKPGDLCMIVGSPYPENNGKSGVVLRRPSRGDAKRSKYLDELWMLKFPRAMRWPHGNYDDTGAVWQGYLRKISGPDIGLEVLRHDAAPVKGAEHA